MSSMQVEVGSIWKKITISMQTSLREIWEQISNYEELLRCVTSPKSD